MIVYMIVYMITNCPDGGVSVSIASPLAPPVDASCRADSRCEGAEVYFGADVSETRREISPTLFTRLTASETRGCRSNQEDTEIKDCDFTRVRPLKAEKRDEAGGERRSDNTPLTDGRGRNNRHIRVCSHQVVEGRLEQQEMTQISEKNKHVAASHRRETFTAVSGGGQSAPSREEPGLFQSQSQVHVFK